MREREEARWEKRDGVCEQEERGTRFFEKGRGYKSKEHRSVRRNDDACVCVCVCGLPQIDFLFNLVIVINVRSLARSTSNFLASLCS